MALALGYVGLGLSVLTLTGRPWFLAPAWWVWSGLFVVLSLPWLGWQYLRSPKRFAAAWSRLPAAAGLIAVLIPVQVTFQALKQSIGPWFGFPADPWLHQLDVWIHGGMAWELVPWAFTPDILRLLDRLYVVWFFGLLAFVLWAAWTRHAALRQRALLGFLLIWIVAGTLTAAALPSAGPCYYEAVTGGTEYQSLLAQLPADSFARVNQMGIWRYAQDGTWGMFAGISAMPSLHVAIAVFWALVAWERSRVLGGLLIGYAVIIQLGSVVLAWHYAVDGYAGALLAWGAWRAAAVTLTAAVD